MVGNGEMFETPCIRLRVLRQVLNLKQVTFAKFLDIAANTLRSWEYEGYSLSVKYRNRLRFVGINSQWLEYGTGELFMYDIDSVREKILFSVNNSNWKEKV